MLSVVALYCCCCPFSEILQPITLAWMIDLLRISVFNDDDFKTEFIVLIDGRITFLLIGVVTASGKSSPEMEEVIAVYLIDGCFIQDTRVSVTELKHVSKQVSRMGNIQGKRIKTPLKTG